MGAKGGVKNVSVGGGGGGGAGAIPYHTYKYVYPGNYGKWLNGEGIAHQSPFACLFVVVALALLGMIMDVKAF